MAGPNPERPPTRGTEGFDSPWVEPNNDIGIVVLAGAVLYGAATQVFESVLDTGRAQFNSIANRLRRSDTRYRIGVWLGTGDHDENSGVVGQLLTGIGISREEGKK